MFRPWLASAAWLNRAPVEDPVDRRNATMLQVVLILFGFVPPLLWLYRILLSGLPWRPEETTSLAMSLALSVIAIVSLLLVRHGRFRWAAGQLLAVAVLFMIIDYASRGFAAQAYEQPVQVIWIVIAGLVLGRYALWLMYGCHLLAFALGLARDLSLRSGEGFDAWNNQLISALITAVIFLLIAIVVDRSVAALRDSLRDATMRGDELARTNVRLEAEIDERERMRDQLVHAQKVEAVGRLASGVAHDFNHLIGLMLGYAQIGRRSGDAAELKHALAGIEIAAQRAATIAGTLLNFARREATHLEVFDAGAALREMKPMLVQLFDSGVKIDIDTPMMLIPISFDRAHFTLVVLNIAANANQAMPRGGIFRVTARASQDAGVELDLTDTGHGMSPDVKRRIFEPFFTTKPREQGIGLGLAVAINLVNSAGGEITVESEPERGSTFHVRFLGPAAASALLESSPREGVAPIAG